jgi:hypothetical protein
MLSRDLRNIALQIQRTVLGRSETELLAKRLYAIAEGVENMEAMQVPPHLRTVIPAEVLGERIVPLRRPTPKGERR